MKFKKGNHVRWRPVGWKYVGTIIDTEPCLTMNGVQMSSNRYQVKWDDEEDGVSGWLREGELTLDNNAHEAELNPPQTLM